MTQTETDRPHPLVEVVLRGLVVHVANDPSRSVARIHLYEDRLGGRHVQQDVPVSLFEDEPVLRDVLDALQDQVRRLPLDPARLP